MVRQKLDWLSRPSTTWKLVIFLLILLVYLWSGLIDWPYIHATATSPDGRTQAISVRWRTWTSFRGQYLGHGRHTHGRHTYYVRLKPRRRFICATPNLRWDGASRTLDKPRKRHIYALYADYTESKHLPAEIKWTANDEFTILGGDGSGARFKIVEE